jgi:putative endonuclease
MWTKPSHRNGKAARRRALRRGTFAERLAAISLWMKGYRIVQRNFRCKAGEIDIIARRGVLIAFVEVKARNCAIAAIDAVSHASQQRINNAAEYWIAKQRDAATLSWRFDIVAVIPWRWPVHFPDAF